MKSWTWCLGRHRLVYEVYDDMESLHEDELSAESLIDFLAMAAVSIAFPLLYSRFCETTKRLHCVFFFILRIFLNAII